MGSIEVVKATLETPYPRTFEEFLEWFSAEDDCRAYLEWIRWPAGFVCPQCGGTEAWHTERGLWHCQKCRHQSSVTAGTVFEDSRKPLRLWFHVMWLMMAQKTGLSAKNLCDTYGFGSYQTAWGWLQKLRSVMIRSGRERLVGRVEVDEAFVGGQKEGTRGRGADGKTLVLVAVEGDARKRLGRVRFRCVAAINRETVEAFVRDYVEPSTKVVTDGLGVYDKLEAAGFSMPLMLSPQVETLRFNNLTMSIWSSPCSSVGWAALTKGRSPLFICRPTLTSSRSVSTAVSRNIVACSSTASSSKP